MSLSARRCRTVRCRDLGVGVACLVVSSLTAAESSLTVILSADTGAQIGPCISCSDGVGDGLARRLTFLNAVREAEPASLFVDAGNALFGSGGGARFDADVVVEAYTAMRYDAVNLSYRDFRQGKAATLAALSEEGVPFVSANLEDAESGTLLARPFVTVHKGEASIAILGVTQNPARSAALAHLDRQLAGIRISDPVEALKEELSKLESTVDAIVVLYYGNGEGAARIRREFAGRVDALLVGGMGTPWLGTRGAPIVGVAATGGVSLTVGKITKRESGTAGVFEHVALGESVSPHAELAATLRARLPHRKPNERSAVAETAAPQLLKESPSPGQRQTLNQIGRNRALRITVAAATLAETPENDGVKSLLLETTWENALAPDVIYGLGYGEAVHISDLSRELFLLVDGMHVLRPLPFDETLEKQLPKGFSLAEPGTTRRGVVGYAWPFETVGSIELRYYSQRFAAVGVSLLGEASVAETRAETELQSNTVMALTARLAEAKPLPRRPVPRPGMRYLDVQVQGRSLLAHSIDARRLERKAAVDATAELGIVYEYLEAARTMQLLVDAEYAYPVEWPLGTLAPDPPLLPDRMGGGTAVFLIPETAKSFELAAFFPKVRLSTGEDFGMPKALRFPLAARATSKPPGEPLAVLPDEPVTVSLESLQLLDRFAGETSTDGKSFLVLEVAVENKGTEAGAYSVLKRYRLAAAGEELAPDRRTALGPYRPIDPLWLPVGERRRFQLVYEVSKATQLAQLNYTGIHQTSSVELPLATQPGAVAVKTTRTKQSKLETSRPDPNAAQGEAVVPQPETSSLEPQGLAGVGLTAQEVNEAIERGRDFLWKTLREKTNGNANAFPYSKDDTIAALALVHAGAHRKYPEFDRYVRSWLGHQSPESKRRSRYPNGRTYETAVFCMTVDAYGDPFFFGELRRFAQSLVNGQHEDGAWSYAVPRPEADTAQSATAGDQLFTVLGQESAFEALERTVEWKPGGGDNSVSQFAILGLRAARRRGFRVPEDTWQRALAVYERREVKDGGWGYTVAASAYGSMTCAGVCSLLLGRWALGEPQPEGHPAIRRGLDWLATNFSSSANAARPGHHNSYYLYSLERVGRLFGMDFIGQHEWYPLGARTLLRSQLEDGGWVEGKERIVPTSFALLFLTQATESLVEEVQKDGPGTLRTVLRTAAAPRYYLVLDASGSMLAKMEGTTKFEIARRTVVDLIERLPATAEVALRVYGHRKRAREKDADKDTELVLPMKPLVPAHRSALLNRLWALRARGKTPLVLTLEKSIDDVARMGSKAKTTIVLLSDGGDDTRGRTPLRAPSRIARDRNLTLAVVGFDVRAARGRKQLETIAREAKGVHLTATDTATLTASLRSAFGEVEKDFVIQSAAGTEVARGVLGDALELPAGIYRLVARPSGKDQVTEFRVRPGRDVTIVCRADAADRAE